MQKMIMRFCLLAACSLWFTISHAQQNPFLIDSLKRKFAEAKSSEDKVSVAGKLARILMNTNIPEADNYAKLMREEAEASRSRPLMFKALYVNGERYSYFGSNKELVQKSIQYFNQALDFAKENKMEKEQAETLLALSAVHLQIPDIETSLSYTTQASSLSSTIRSDSLMAAIYNSFGNAYQVKKERLLALRNYLNALHIAEEMKNPNVLGDCYSNMMQFYADIKGFDKAIDFAKKGLDELELTHTGGENYRKVVGLFYIGTLYMLKKDFDMSVSYFEKSIALADSLKYPAMKMPAYQGLLGQYMSSNQPQKALEYLNGKPELKSYITSFGLGHVIDRFYAVIYKNMGRYDSAQYYFAKAAPAYEARGTLTNKLEFYYQYADFYKKEGNNAKAIEYYSKAEDLANQTADLEWKQNVANELDTVYANEGDYKKSHLYMGLYHEYKDSLQKLGDEKEMLQAELEDEQLRQARIAREEEAALEKKHTVQYMGITIAIAVTFLLLVIMGAFKVSEATIRVMGFFAFIFLFEFIILLADTKIHHWTNGEPLPILGIKIILIAMLLPLHHWLEHRVVSYLASRRLIVPDKKSIWNHLRAKAKPVEH